jgi:hypothetical protein
MPRIFRRRISWVSNTNTHAARTRAGAHEAHPICLKELAAALIHSWQDRGIGVGCGLKNPGHRGAPQGISEQLLRLGVEFRPSHLSYALRAQVTYYVRQLVWLRAARLQSLDFLAQVAGEVRAVRRLEVTKGSHGCREMITPPLQVVEHFSAAIFTLTIELLSATMCIGIEALCIDPGFGLDPRGTCTGAGGELMCGPVGLLSDPVGIRVASSTRRSVCSVDSSMRRTTAALASFPVVTAIVPDAGGCTGAGCPGTGG